MTSIADEITHLAGQLVAAAYRGNVDEVCLYANDVGALAADVERLELRCASASLAAEVEALKAALRRTVRERDEWRAAARAAKCDDVLEDRLRASLARLTTDTGGRT